MCNARQILLPVRSWFSDGFYNQSRLVLLNGPVFTFLKATEVILNFVHRNDSFCRLSTENLWFQDILARYSWIHHRTVHNYLIKLLLFCRLVASKRSGELYSDPQTVCTSRVQEWCRIFCQESASIDPSLVNSASSTAASHLKGQVSPVRHPGSTWTIQCTSYCAVEN